MTSLAIRGGTVDVTADGRLIASVGAHDADPSALVVDATGCSVLPGFVDLQINGAIGVDFASQPERLGEVAEFVVQCGVTSFMPTVISSSVADTLRAIETMGQWSHESRPAARSLGLHLEGPFLNPQRAGAHPLHQLRSPSLTEVQGWTRSAGVAMV